jgi:hypothetical protein
MNEIEKLKEIYMLLKILKITVKLNNTKLKKELIEKEIKEIIKIIEEFNILPKFF